MVVHGEGDRMKRDDMATDLEDRAGHVLDQAQREDIISRDCTKSQYLGL
jgi:hypothetical protein